MVSLVRKIFISRNNKNYVLYPKEYFDTDSTIPPSKSSNKPSFGSYCIKAKINRYDNNGNLKSQFVGYSQDMNRILDEIENHCDRRCKYNEYCCDTRIIFMGAMENCNGLIVENFPNGETVIKQHSHL